QRTFHVPLVPAQAGTQYSSKTLDSRMRGNERTREPGLLKDETMSGAEVLDVARDAVLTLVLVASPLMLIGLIVGVVISLFQALTQIQEMTLVFVPKILAIFIAMLVALPFMADLLQGQMSRLAARIVAMGSSSS